MTASTAAPAMPRRRRTISIRPVRGLNGVELIRPSTAYTAGRAPAGVSPGCRSTRAFTQISTYWPWSKRTRSWSSGLALLRSRYSTEMSAR
jgi:hypothetical protein